MDRGGEVVGGGGEEQSQVLRIQEGGDIAPPKEAPVGSYSNQEKSNSSTSKINTAFGGIGPPGVPLAP